MQKQIKQLEEFHNKFDAGKPNVPMSELAEIRIKVMQGEMDELIEALRNEPLINVAKELIDVLYTIFGTAVVYGWGDKLEAMFDEVHASNMSKDPNPEGHKPIKGTNYFAADFKKFFKE